MPPLAGYWHSFLTRHAKVLKAAYKEASKAIKQNLPKQAAPEAQPILIRNTPRQPLHPAARIRQQQSRWYSTSRHTGFRAAIRHFTSTAEQHFPSSGAKQTLRSSYPKSSVSNSISRSPGRAPFASTLRPNLTGGALGRTAGGYSLGAGKTGGARYFSHGPAAQAQVVQNVSQAVRAFFISGQKAQFDGINPRSGEKRYKAVSTLQEETSRKLNNLPKATPGSYLDFAVNPTITALTSLNGVAGFTPSEKSSNDYHINTSGLLDVLSVDFSRALKDLAAVLNDLKRISQLGDLPITYQGSNLRVHFPGCDAETVENLCKEFGVQRGIVTQDEDFDAFAGTEIALLFPFAPSTVPSVAASEENDAAIWFEQPRKQKVEWHTMVSPSTVSDEDEHFSTISAQTEDMEDDDLHFELPESSKNPWESDSPSTRSGYETLHYSSPSHSSGHTGVESAGPLEYQGLEGIYRFIEECDTARSRRF